MFLLLSFAQQSNRHKSSGWFGYRRFLSVSQWRKYSRLWAEKIYRAKTEREREAARAFKCATTTNFVASRYYLCLWGCSRPITGGQLLLITGFTSRKNSGERRKKKKKKTQIKAPKNELGSAQQDEKEGAENKETKKKTSSWDYAAYLLCCLHCSAAGGPFLSRRIPFRKRKEKKETTQTDEILPNNTHTHVCTVVVVTEWELISRNGHNGFKSEERGGGSVFSFLFLCLRPPCQMYIRALQFHFFSLTTGWRAAEHGRRRVEDVVIGRIAGFFDPATVPAGGQERPHVLGKCLSLLLLLLLLSRFVVNVISTSSSSSTVSRPLVQFLSFFSLSLSLRIPDEAISRQEPPQQQQQ